MVRILTKSTLSLHFEKHKKPGRNFQRHVERVPGQNHSNENINPEKTAQNIFLKEPDDLTYNERINEILENGYHGKSKIRKDAVRMLSTTVQLGGDVAEKCTEDEQIEVLKSAAEWLTDRYGEQNVVASVIHLDETTPHLHFDFVPLFEDGRLSANALLGGKMGLKKLQGEFLSDMQEKHAEFAFGRKDDQTLNGMEQEMYQLLTKKLEKEKEELSDWENDLLDGEEKLEKAQDDLKASQKALRASETALSDREAQVTRKEQKLALRDSELSQREDRLKSDQDVLKSSQKALRDSESRLSNREAQTSKKEKELSERERELSESKKKADDEIKHRKNHLQKSYDDAMDKVKKREEKLDQKDNSLAKKSQELSATSDRLKLFQQQLDAKKAEQEEFQKELEEERSLLERLKQEFAQAKKDFLQNLNKLYQGIMKPDISLWEKTKKSTLFEELDNVMKNPEPETIEKANNTTKSLLNSKTDDDSSRSEADQIGDDLAAGLAGLADMMDQFDQPQQ